MIVIITGTPGTGKTSLAKALKASLGSKYLLVNDKEFCKKHKLGKLDRKNQEIIVPLKKFEKLASQFIKAKKGQNIIFEGHLFCETKLKAELAVLLHCDPKLLEERLWEKGYSQVKILDNVFCEMTGYCKSKVLENFPKTRLLEFQNDKGLKEITAKILQEIKKLQKR